MIDYVKILFRDIDVTRLLNLSSLDFKTEVSESTGELSSKKVTNYKFCKITIYNENIVLFTGSIHKLWNELHGIKAPNHKEVKKYRGFNGNLFTIYNIIEVREHLQKLFNCTPEQMLFQNIEFGVNTTPIFKPQQYLKGLLYHNNILFEHRFKGNYAQAPHQRYILKIYNKSKQYNMDNDVLRIELKIIKTEELKTIGIKTFADINANALDKVAELLLKRFDEVMHYDYTIQKSMLSNLLKHSLKDYSRPHYWLDEVEPRHRDRYKKRLKEITRNHSENLHLQVRQNIIEKCVIINRPPKPLNCVTINNSNIELNITHLDNRNCLVTGLDISIQKESSFLLSHTGLRHLYKTDRKLYEDIKQKYLSIIWVNVDLDTEIKEIAHNIRNRYNSQRIKQQRLYPVYQVNLFNI